MEFVVLAGRLCLERAVTRRCREPLAVFTDYAVFGLTGLALGSLSEHGRGTLPRFTVEMDYNNVALALMAGVVGLRTFSANRMVYCREAASGLNKLAHFAALDTFGHVGTAVRSAVYLVMYAAYAQPRAALWRMYLVTAAIVYACTGLAYVLSQALDPAPAQLSAAVIALISVLVARANQSSGLLWAAWQASFAHWSLQAYVVAEAQELTGVWLLARCADLQGLGYSVASFWRCIAALGITGVVTRAASVAAMFILHRS